jgi:hypothetical protein
MNRTRTPGDGPKCWCGQPATFGGSCSAHFDSDTGKHTPRESAPDSNPMHAIGYGRGDDNSTRATLAAANELNQRLVKRCSICGSSEGVRRFAVTVDGNELRAVAALCAEHGDAHLLNVGRVLGSLFARVNDPVVDCGEPAPVGAARCIRGHGHTGDHVASPLEGWANVGNTRVPK